MTPVYEVNTKHTEKVLKDFIAFNQAIKNPRVTFQLGMLAVCSATLTYIGRGTVLMYIFAVLTAVILIFAIARPSMAFKRLSKADANYTNQSEIHFMFGESEFRVENKEISQDERFKYAEINVMYEDSAYYYLHVNNEDLYMLPKMDFTVGSQDKFHDFIERKVEKNLQPVKLSWRMKYAILKQALVTTRTENNKKNQKPGAK